MLKYTLTIQISWGHCDPAKIVFYPNYFIWFDQSAHLLFDKAGANMGDLIKQYLSLIEFFERTRRYATSYAVFCLK